MKVLLVAPSNDASDVLTSRLAVSMPPSEVRRILAYSRTISSVSPNIMDYCKEYTSAEDQLSEILSARVVVCTANYAARLSYIGVPRNHFDVLCVDEAGHATEPEVVSVAASLFDFTVNTSGKRQMVLAGDPKQLGPVISSSICQAFGMSVSYLERLMGRDLYGRSGADGSPTAYPPDLLTKLVRNYRTHPTILKLPNAMFYNNELDCCGDVFSTHSYAKWEHLPTHGFPILFHNMHSQNLREGNSPSWFSPEEAQQVVMYVRLLLESRPPIKEEDVGIITPYARQAQKIRLALQKMGMAKIKVGSVECFQGQERRIIIVSTVRSETEYLSSDLKHNLGFVANEKRFNVAITRAKALLIVVGCAKVLSLDRNSWLPFLRFCHENGSIVGEDWEPPTEETNGSGVGDVRAREALNTSPSNPFVNWLRNMSLAPANSSASEESEWQIIPGPSKAAEEEAAVFINREE